MAGQVGATSNYYFGHIQGTTGNAAGLDFSQRGLQNSVLYGGKVGYYLDDPAWKWLGVEMEMFTRINRWRRASATPFIHRGRRHRLAFLGRLYGLMR